MVLDRTWNKYEQKFVISYINKEGKREFYQKYLHHIKGYEYDENGEFETWNGKRCRKVYKDTHDYTPNEFELLEYMYEMEEDQLKTLHAQNFAKIYAFDIETEYSDTFPYPDKAEFKVTAISLVAPDMSCIVYGLKPMTEDQIETFRQRYTNWIKDNTFARNLLEKQEKPIRVLYQYFAKEEDMLQHFFCNVISKIPILVGWNSYNFDYQYLYNRLVRLFGEGMARNMVKKCSPTGEIFNARIEVNKGLHIRLPLPRHTIILDYMKLVEQYDYVLRPYESFSLDWVGSRAVNAHKIKYEGGLQQLYEKDPEWYYFYNAVDSLIVLLIHYRLKSIESPSAVSSITLVPLMDAMGQVALTTANVFEEFYKDNKKVVYDYDAIERVKHAYEGAFCGCVSGRYEWTVCDDFKSLYPSQVQTCNFSFENFVEKKIGPDSLGRYIKENWTKEELDQYSKDPNYFVSLMGSVYKNDKDYAFKRLQKRLMDERAVYKYTGQKIDSELLVKLDKRIKQLEKASA